MQNASAAGGQPCATGDAVASPDLSRLVHGIAGRLHGRLPKGCGVELADLIQAGNVGLLKAERSFEPGAGVPLAGYAKFRIRGEMLDMIRRSASRKLAPAPDPDPGSNTAADDWIDHLPASMDSSPHCSVLRRQQSAILRDEIRRLPERYRRVVSMRYSAELSLREIGAELKVKESRASQIHRLALIRLRRALSIRGVRAMSQVL